MDGQRWTAGQANESDFIGRCPTNVERPRTELILLTCVN